jgi:hypothetical protein
MIQAAMTFALSSNGRVVHIDDVPNGVQCGCICPQCKRLLIAKNGGYKRAHHFAHESETKCKGGTETIIHLAAKQIVADYKLVALPFLLGEISGEEIQLAEFDNVLLEHPFVSSTTQQRIIADCYGQNASGGLIVEIAVHHRVEADKARLLEALGLPAMEIDLADKIGEMIGWEDLTQAVLFESYRRRWIFTPSLDGVKAPVEEIQQAPTRENSTNLKKWRFAFGSTWVWVTELPYGNISVYHRYDARVRQIVEPICKKRGYWNAQYRNWIVFDQFKTELLELLARH